MRTTVPQTPKEIIKTITPGQLDQSQNHSTNFVPYPMPTKLDLWTSFLKTFKLLHNKDFVETPEAIENLKPLFLYFLRDPQFFNCNTLNSDISEPSFDKGLMVMGGYGLGKTAYFKVFEKMFNNHPSFRFKAYSTKHIVNLYEQISQPLDKKSFIDEMSRKLMFIDDLSAEREASNYGKVDILNDVLSLRYEKNLRTFISCNYSDNRHDLQATLENLGDRYGSRNYDRFFEMLNFVEFKGKSHRR